MALSRHVVSLFAILWLMTGCGNMGQTDLATSATQIVTGLVTQGEPAQLTATRASLEAAGFDQPLLVVTVRQPNVLRAGFLLAGATDGVLIWRAADGSTVKAEGGVLRGTVGFGFDLDSAETAPTLRALSTQDTAPYFRTYRHLSGLNQIRRTRYVCRLQPPVAERIIVFDRAHDTLKFVELCTAETGQTPDADATIENIYWQDRRRPILWRTDQSVSDELGNALFERVIE